jgi:hypothetical protein
MTTPGEAAMSAGAAANMALTEMSVTADQSALNASSSGSLRISTLPGSPSRVIRWPPARLFG